MRFKGDAVEFADGIKDRVERTFGHFARIEQLQRSSARVARIGKGFEARILALIVEERKALRVHIHFAADFKNRRRH